MDSLQSLSIGNNCFEPLAIFSIDGLTSLTSLSIGSNSFTQHPNGFGNDSSKSFHILNCNKLESISIGKYSFSDYSGEFELLNLPELQSISIGDMNSNSYNFYSASLFEINSNIIIKVCNIDMPNLESVILGAYSFHSVLEIVFDGRNIF